MTPVQLEEILSSGEDGSHRFLPRPERQDEIARELCALANGGGGMLLVGAWEDGTVEGLSGPEVREFNRQLADAAGRLRPPLFPQTENVTVPDGVVVAVRVEPGAGAPHVDRLGRVWMRCGAQSRAVTSREELERLYLRSARFEADLLPVETASVADLDLSALRRQVAALHPSLTEGDPADERLLAGLGLLREGCPTTAAVLLFSRHAFRDLPAVHLRVAAFPGDDPADGPTAAGTIGGTLRQQFQGGMDFARERLGAGERLEAVLGELLVNALVHRDLLVRAPVRLLVFRRRVEVVSPGVLPGGLTTDALAKGACCRRNPLLARHAEVLLPFRGLGTGILRALRAAPGMLFENDAERDEFRAVVPRSAVPPAEVREPVREQGASGELARLAGLVKGEMTRSAMQEAFGYRNRTSFMNAVLKPALEAGLVEMTVPDRPQSRNQRYRLTEKGRRP